MPQEEIAEAASAALAGDASDADELRRLDKAHVLHAHQVVGDRAEPLIVVRGRGARIWDIDGREYVDGTCGLQQCAVGHGREELARVAAAQLAELEFYPTF